MAKGFERKEYQKSRGMEYAGHPDSPIIRKLGEIVSDMYLSTEESDHRRMWASAARLLAQTKADKDRVAAIVQSKRIGALSTLVIDLQKEMNAPKVGRGALGGASADAQVIGGTSAVTVANQISEASGGEVKGSVTTPEGSVISDGAGDGPARNAEKEQLKHALKAFRKRLKLTRLDEESKLGNRAMTGGRKSAIIAIMPPREYPRSVWDELVAQGKLKNAGNGCYELVE